MTRRSFLTTSAAAAQAAGDRHNILLILMDDMAQRALGCYGNKAVTTPHLDRLASEGVRFTDAYATPQCTPTRATLLSGQYTARHGMWHVIPWYGLPWARVTEPEYRTQFPRDAFTLAKGLRAAGYATACLGKWHLTTNEDGNYGSLLPSAASHYGFDVGLAPIPKAVMDHDRAVDLLTGRAIDFIEQNRARPWLCYLSHHATHRVLAAPAELVEKYRKAGHPETGFNNALSLASMEHMDQAIGRLVGKLDELGLGSKTAVIFVTDNGGVTDIYNPKPVRDGDGWRLTPEKGDVDSRPLRAGKGFAYEGGIRVPMIVRWTGQVKPERVEQTPVHVVDLLPTLLALAGATVPAGYPVDGVNLLPLWRKGTRPPVRALYWYMPLYDLRWAATPCAVMREGDYKLIEYFGDWFSAEPNGNLRYQTGQRLELYHLRRDPGERRNLAPTQSQRAASMQRRLQEWIRASGAAVPGANPRHDPARELQESRVRPSAPGRETP